jgi:spermidine synthase
VLVLFSVPITLLGTVSPFAIRLAITSPEKAGDISGRIYALSTLGSFIGTFLPVLVLIPLVGTTLTFLVFSLVLLAVAFFGLYLSRSNRRLLALSWMPLVLLAATFIWGDTPFKRTPGQVLETESAYNYIEVLERDGFTMLRLNEGQGVHSMYHPTQLNYYGPWEQFLVAPFFIPDTSPADVNRIGIVGLAAGTSARQASAVFGPVPIDGWELDPEIIDIGRRYFGLDLPNLNAIAQDGRWGLASSTQRYTVIGVDAYRPPYIPWHLTTQEFFQVVFDHLEPRGVMVINIGRAPEDRRLVDGLVGTIGSIFPSVYVVDVPNTFNSIVFATRLPSSFDDLLRNYLVLQADPAVHPLLLEAMATAISSRQPTPESATVFTDDRAPIEWLTNSLVLKFLLSNGTQGLQ